VNSPYCVHGEICNLQLLLWVVLRIQAFARLWGSVGCAAVLKSDRCKREAPGAVEVPTDFVAFSSISE